MRSRLLIPVVYISVKNPYAEDFSHELVRVTQQFVPCEMYDMHTYKFAG